MTDAITQTLLGAGVAGAVLVAVGMGLYWVVRWAAAQFEWFKINTVLPVVKSHIAFVDSVKEATIKQQASLEKQSETMDKMTALQAQQTQIMGQGSQDMGKMVETTVRIGESTAKLAETTGKLADTAQGNSAILRRLTCAEGREAPPLHPKPLPKIEDKTT